MPKTPEAPERTDEVSADLAYELQARLFEQLATVGLGGAGLSITLAGSILRDSPLVWFSVIEFGIAAMTALSAHQGQTEKLFRREPTRKRSKRLNGICMMLIGMGVGSLAAAVYLTGDLGSSATALMN